MSVHLSSVGLLQGTVAYTDEIPAVGGSMAKAEAQKEEDKDEKKTREAPHRPSPNGSENERFSHDPSSCPLAIASVEEGWCTFCVVGARPSFSQGTSRTIKIRADGNHCTPLRNGIHRDEEEEDDDEAEGGGGGGGGGGAPAGGTPDHLNVSGEEAEDEEEKEKEGTGGESTRAVLSCQRNASRQTNVGSQDTDGGCHVDGEGEGWWWSSSSWWWWFTSVKICGRVFDRRGKTEGWCGTCCRSSRFVVPP